METHLTNLQKFLSQLQPYNNIDEERHAVIEAFKAYIKALYGSLSDEDAQKLHNLLYLLLRSIEDNYGL